MEKSYVHHWEKMYQSFLLELSNVKSRNQDTLKMASDSIGICQQYLATLKAEIGDQGSFDKETEIAFFKQFKPLFFSHYIFFRKLFNIELKVPIAAPHVVEEYYLKHLVNLTLFFDDNIELYQYYRTKSTYKDEHFFMRLPMGKGVADYSRHPNADPKFTTEHDYTFSKIIAYEMLANYLQEALANLKDRHTGIPKADTSERKLTWTATKISFIEMVYAFKAGAVFNNGTATIKLIASQLGSFLGIDPGNTSRSAQELLSREKGLTDTLDFLKTRLQEWSDRLHEI